MWNMIISPFSKSIVWRLDSWFGINSIVCGIKSLHSALVVIPFSSILFYVTLVFVDISPAAIFADFYIQCILLPSTHPSPFFNCSTPFHLSTCYTESILLIILPNNVACLDTTMKIPINIINQQFPQQHLQLPAIIPHYLRRLLNFSLEQCFDLR